MLDTSGITYCSNRNCTLECVRQFRNVKCDNETVYTVDSFKIEKSGDCKSQIKID